jgi:LmbE family N-acetylglucosaminyl deacetylase
MAANLKRTILNVAKPFILPYTRQKLKGFYKEEQALTRITEGNVLVLAPHVDDETIGLGGTIIEHVKKGQHVTVAYITDGSGSVSSLSKEELMAKRKQEAKEVQQLLGFQDMVFLDLPDGALESNEHSRELFRSLIEEKNPAFIYCPTFVDCHPDHVTTGRILSDVLKEKQYSGAVRMYEINCPIPPNEINTVIDITDAFETKEKAVDIFQSQAIDFDGFIELSKIKTELVPGTNANAVETFLEIPASEFPGQYQRVDQKKYPYNQIFKQVNKAATLIWGILKNVDEKKRMYKERHSGQGGSI